MKSTIIYNRTSTEDQNPENQVENCKEITTRLNILDFEIFEEQKSAFKDDEKRVIFNEVKRQIKTREVKNFIVWDLDRIYRNRKKLISFFKFCKFYGCKIYSYRQQFLEDINKSPEPWNEMLFDNMIFILGWIAEDESAKKSERIKASIRTDRKGRTVSYKGNKWGRRAVSLKVKQNILKLHEQGKLYREICGEVYYWDAAKHKKFVSIGFVHKTIEEFKARKGSKTAVHNLPN